MKQRAADLLFKLGDLKRERRLGDVQLLGRLSERSRFGNRDEVLKLTKAHRKHLLTRAALSGRVAHLVGAGTLG